MDQLALKASLLRSFQIAQQMDATLQFEHFD
jgi:hypothetical protein